VSEGSLVAVVCTANQCRSPLAAAILGRELAHTDPRVTVVSFGTEATGLPATPGTVDAAQRLGIDLSAHTSSPIDPDVVAAAALVLTMERRHVQDVAIAVPGAFPRTFTLKELVRRGSDVGPRLPGVGLNTWLEHAADGRRPTDVLGRSRSDDVADPTVDPLVDHDALAAELSELSGRLVALAWPSSG
jgi:protein-tyrosine phosphatase